MWAYREIYWCRRSLIKKFCPVEEPDEDLNKVHTDNLPWFWIGIAYPDKQVISVTSIVNDNIYYGMRITPEYLSKLTGFTDGNWKYIDAKTLEEKDFPSDGFVIEDVLDKQISDSE